MRLSTLAWWCGNCSCRNIPENSRCVHCGHLHHERHAQVHASERSVVYFNPATGEHRTPPRNDLPMPVVYKQQGFERREIMNMGQWEKEVGVVHEATSFSAGNEPIPTGVEAPKHDPKVIDDLARIIADGNASGPWT